MDEARAAHAAFVAGYARACADHCVDFWSSWAEEGWAVWALRRWLLALRVTRAVLSPAPANGPSPEKGR
jgi:hypothetical protein